MPNITEQLLRPCEVYRKLRISKSKFYRIQSRLIAAGMKRVKIDGNNKFLESSIDEMIRKAAESEMPLV